LNPICARIGLVEEPGCIRSAWPPQSAGEPSGEPCGSRVQWTSRPSGIGWSTPAP